MNDELNDELTAFALNKNDPVIAMLIDRVESQLLRSNYEGPQKFFGAGVSEILIEVLLEVLTNCFTKNLGGSRNALARSIREPNGLQKVLLKVKIRNELFRGDRRDYREGDGDTLLAALLYAAGSAEIGEIEQLANYVGENNLVDHGSL